MTDNMHPALYVTTMTIHILNHADGDVLTYSLVIITGTIESYTSDGQVEIWTEQRGRHLSIHWPVIEGCFKASVILDLGSNSVCIYFSESTQHSINLTYCLENVQFIVRPVYIICNDDDGCFQGPKMEDCSAESACRRIQLGAQLIQSLTAEKLCEQKFDRKTFHIESDALGYPICHTFRSKLSLSEAYKMTGNELWTYFGRELMTSSQFGNKDKCKWYCFMSFTRYEPPPLTTPKSHADILKYTKGHTALGGGGLALFGTGTLHTWASNLRELIARLTDTRKIDRTVLMDDSAYRNYYWANYATGLGASLHELGHTFDLAHTISGIMARGFDDLHKVFLVQRSKLQSPQTANYSRPPPLMVAIEPGFRTSRMSSVVMVRHGGSRHGSPASTPTASPCVSRRRVSSISSMSLGDSPARLLSVPREDNIVPSNLPREDLNSPSKLPRSRTRSHSCSDDTTAVPTSLHSRSHSNQSVVPTRPTRPRLGSEIESPGLPYSRCRSGSEIESPGLPHSRCRSGSETFLSRHKDNGAHWHRASAVLLNYHKWFNKPTQVCNTLPTIEGCHIDAPCGLRLIQLRSDPEGMVFHHWEFIDDSPPTEFTLHISRMRHLPLAAVSIAVLVQDHCGNILKRRFKITAIPS